MDPDVKSFNQLHLDDWQKKAETFCKLMENLFKARTLDVQKETFGPLLRKPLPLTHHNFPDVISVDSFFLPHIGHDELNNFEYFVLQNTILPSNQDRTVVAVAQASGSGKTRLCYSIGTERDYYSIYIPIYQTALMETVATLENYINGLSKSSEKKELAQHGLHAFRVFVFAHIEWAITVAKYFNDRSQAREACLRALENGHGQRGVSIILQQRFGYLKKLKDEEERRKYLSDYLDDIKKLVDTRRLLLFFDEVVSLKCKCQDVFINYDEYEGLEDNNQHESPDLYYGLKLVLLKLMNVTSWGLTIADTHFSIFDIIQEQAKSPTRGKVKPFSILHKLTQQDMVTLLSEYFILDESQHFNELSKFIGRPKFFFLHFLPRFFGKMERTKPTATSDLTNIITSSANEAYKESVDYIEKLLLNYCQRNNIINQKTQISARILISRLYIAWRLYGDISIVINDRDANSKLVSMGLLASTSENLSQQHYSISDEPVFAQALINCFEKHIMPDPNEDKIFQSLMLPCQFLEHRIGTKGTAGELLPIWYILRKVLNSVDQSITLYDLIEDLVPPNFIRLQQWRNLHIRVTRASAADSALDIMALNPKDTNWDDKVLVHRISNMAGPDICCLIKRQYLDEDEINTEQLGVLVIQSKIKQKTDLTDALRSIDPGFIWTTEAQRKLVFGGESKDAKADWRTNNKKRRKYYDWMETNPTFEEIWVRAIFAGQPYDDSLINRTNEFNNANPHRPLLLLHVTEKAFGKDCYNLIHESASFKIPDNFELADMAINSFTETKKMEDSIQTAQNTQNNGPKPTTTRKGANSKK